MHKQLDDFQLWMTDPASDELVVRLRDRRNKLIRDLIKEHDGGGIGELNKILAIIEDARK